MTLRPTRRRRFDGLGRHFRYLHRDSSLPLSRRQRRSRGSTCQARIALAPGRLGGCLPRGRASDPRGRRRRRWTRRPRGERREVRHWSRCGRDGRSPSFCPLSRSLHAAHRGRMAIGVNGAPPRRRDGRLTKEGSSGQQGRRSRGRRRPGRDDSRPSREAVWKAKTIEFHRSPAARSVAAV